MHSQAGNGRGKDWSRHGNKLTERGALTFWRRQRKGLVRTRDKTDRARHTHFLDTSEGRTCQDTGYNRPIEAHLLPGDIRGRDLSRHGIKPTDRGALTSWRHQREVLVKTRNQTDRSRCTYILRHQREGLVKTRNQTDGARHTHFLGIAEGGTYQDMRRNRRSKAHSLPGDGRGRDLSGHEMKPIERGPLTSWIHQREGLVRTRDKTDRSRRTYFLETSEGRTCQDTESNRRSETRSLSGDSRRRDLSGHEKKPTEQGTLTSWRR